MPATQHVTLIRKGLDLPLLGSPQQRIVAGPVVSQVALLGQDYVGMKPTMLVAPGDRVKLGQPVLEDKKNPGVFFVAPATGTVADVVRGPKRRFDALIIDIDPSSNEAVMFDQAKRAEIASLGRQGVTDALTASGLWTAMRTRPFGRSPQLGTVPHSIFVTAIDTNPLSADPAVVLADRSDQFVLGLRALKQLTDGLVFVCKAESSQVTGTDIDGVRQESFAGPHPAGLAGTHIHYLDPVGPGKTVWYVGYQDVVAIGHLFLTGQLDPRRVISLAGPMVKQPRLIEARLGAKIDDLVAGEVETDKTLRVISGSVLDGQVSRVPVNYLGRFHQQISVIEEGNHREFLGWQKPGFDKYSVTRVFASAASPSRKFALTSSTGGSERAMVPLGTYERVMPLDILATQLLRALIVRDTDAAQALGALELEEEDLALCTFVCPGKYEYGALLRETLTTIEREG